MATTLEDLIADQAETAGRIERFLINLRKLGTNNITLTVLETRQELLQSYWKSFTEGHRQVIRKPDAKDSDYIANDRYADVEEIYLQHSVVLKDMIRKLNPSTIDDHRSASTSRRVDNEEDSTLPKIPLPTFSGDLLEWESFRDRFRSLIHDSTRLSKVRKLQYLKSSLTGEAATMLKRTPITDANYDGAWTSLQKRFENKRILSAAHMRRLVHCVPVTKGSPDEIKRLLDEFRQAIDSFAALERPVKEWDEWTGHSALHSLDTYRLATVTYGTAPAPYLALRVLRQLALDEGKRFPLGAQVLLQHSYVDDLLAGGHHLEDTLTVQRELIDILRAGGFQLSKWATSHPLLDLQDSAGTKLFNEPDTHGALGLLWSPITDTLSIKGPAFLPVQLDGCWTKRKVLSELARLFDPMGWLAPVLVRGKILMQDLWLCGVGWDDPIPPPVDASWNSFRESLPELGDVRVPRWVSYIPDKAQVDFHGFCDASERAYCATVFLRVHSTSHRQTFSHLLVARTKVAPVKVISVPRLELCGAILLARLLNQTQRELVLQDARIYVWTDSSVVMAWTRSHASRWKPFVAHRVAEIQRLLPDIPWRHVRSLDNPADLATRGMDSSSFKSLPLWWHGPEWLIRCPKEWPASDLDLKLVEAPEQRNSVVVNAVQESKTNELLARFSNFPRLCRVISLIRRFVFNLRHRGQRQTGFLTSVELSETRNLICRLSQLDTFPDEADDLRKGRPIKLSSPLAALRAFLDEQGLIRVGGRLRQAALSLDYKHPVVISRHSSLARLLVTDAHLATLHGGLTLTRSYLLQRYWIPRGRPLIKEILRSCLRCLRFRGATGRQQMGDLPVSRLQPSRPFLKSGIDYAGPLSLRTTKGRGHKAYKGYIAVFVCLCTKAIHLEVVSDLTSTTFVAAFRRFVSRRGHCAEMLSDNATTFRGAGGELRNLFKAASSFYEEAAETLAMDGTKWSFIPPYSPHFGGLWEAAVKSAKYHLRRVVGDHTLTFEELTTLMCQIEACLNSRPLTALSDDPSDLSSLTPGHFLVGEPLISIPEQNTSDISIHGLARWKLISNLRDHFWRRWTQEYLHQLQQLPKWRRRQHNWKVGTLVLVKDELLPPTKWALGRLLEVHPGKDGLIRVVKVRTATKTMTRSIGTLCPLPDCTTDVPLNQNSEHYTVGSDTH